MCQNKPSIVFGVLADVQYADVDDVLQYGRMRFYRNSLKLLRKTLHNWKQYESENNTKLKFILQLGDLIDGFRAKQINKTDECLNQVLNEFKTAQIDFDNLLHIWGNHELFAYKRTQLSESILNTSKNLNQNLSNSNYYFYDINERIRLICLDQYEISILGLEETDKIYIEALNTINKFTKLRDSTDDLKEKKYLERFRHYNGSISDIQMKWFKDQLNYCQKSNKKVILAGHIPLLPEASDYCTVWNANEILDLIYSYDNLVLAYLAGHYHAGGYYLDKNNIHHLTLNSILETPLEVSNAYVTVFVYENKIIFENQIKSRSFTVFY